MCAVRCGYCKRRYRRDKLRPVRERLLLCGWEHRVRTLPAGKLRLSRRGVHALSERDVQRRERHDLVVHVCAPRMPQGILRS